MCPVSIGVLTVDLKYTFKNWEQHGDRQCAHVEAVGDISTKTISTANGMVVEIKKGKITGEFWYDPALGMIVEANNDQDLAAENHHPGSDHVIAIQPDRSGWRWWTCPEFSKPESSVKRL